MTACRLWIACPPSTTSSGASRAVCWIGLSIAEHLLDRGGNEVRILTQQFPLLGVAEQRQHAVADQVGGGLETADQRDDGARDHLLLAQAITVDSRRDERFEQPARAALL